MRGNGNGRGKKKTQGKKVFPIYLWFVLFQCEKKEEERRGSVILAKEI